MGEMLLFIINLSGLKHDKTKKMWSEQKRGLIYEDYLK